MITAASSTMQFFLNFGIIFGLVVAAGSLFRVSFDWRLSWSLCGLFLCMSLVMVPAALFYYGFEVDQAIMSALLLPLFVAGPLLFVFSGTISGFFQEGFGGHIAGIIAVTLVVVLLYLTGLLGSGSRYFTVSLRAVHGLQFLYVSSYCFRAIKNILNEMGRVKQGQDEIHWLVLLLVGYLLGITIVTVPVVITGRYYHPSYGSVVILLVFHFMLMQKYPLLVGLLVEKKKQNPDQSSVTVDEGELHSLLNHQLDKEKIYLYEDLTLSMLASELNVHSYQLSQFLNNTLGQNFNSLINSYRVRDARHKLIHEPEKSILTIAFEVGFNSKASFNRVFKDITKMSPSEYRKFFASLSREQFYG